VVQKIIDSSTGSVQDTSGDQIETIEEIKSEVVREGFIDSENLQIVREGMRQAVTGENSPLASARLLDSLPVSSAAKTGTAETPFENLYNNWVTVFAPYEDPQIVLTIMIENVEGVRAAAVPMAFEILNWYFTR
jgi:cell division protein FtsI/penicillin-binding protein 2